jgi:hypothetical protein
MARRPEDLPHANRSFGSALRRVLPGVEIVEIAVLGTKLFQEIQGLRGAFKPSREIEADMDAIRAHMAILAQRLILKRAFPTGGTAGRSVTGATFPALNPGYAAIKAKGGLRVGGQRIGPRYPVADQRLSSLTAKSLGVVRTSSDSVTLGFLGGRQQGIAEKLQVRNRFWPLSNDERRKVAELGKREAVQMARKRYSMTGGKKLQVKLRVA